LQPPLSEGSLEVNLPAIWTDEKLSRAEAERRERLEERRSEKRKSQKKKDTDA
jgi:RNase H-fold protein (predicted Holliday junction resolvase)